MLQLRLAPAFALALASLPMISLAASAGSLTMSERKELQQACGPEIKQLCADVKPGGGRIVQCVEAKKDQLSESCSAALQKAKAQRQD